MRFAFIRSSSRIDTAFDFRKDTPPGRDPDALSPTLRKYHKLLWSKSLPGGAMFELLDTTLGIYLHHRSQMGEFWLSSDTVIPTFLNDSRISHVTDKLSSRGVRSFSRLRYTIAGMMVFPAQRVDGRMTINGARGCHPRIKDRFDLTVECIRRHYCNEASPLTNVFARYADFFGLFRDFRGYVDFFLLQDLVTEDCSAVKFFLPFDDFRRPPFPESVSEYSSYRRLAMNFLNARNRRIFESCNV